MMRMNAYVAVIVGLCLVLAAPRQSVAQARFASMRSRTLPERLGYAADAKLLIVHADDLGMAHSINLASIKGLESGLVSSASIMIPCPWLSEIATYARTHPEADLGLHLTLTSEWTSYRWGPVLSRERVPSLLDRDGYLYLTETEAAAHIDPKEAEAEIRAQISRARAFGIQPTHLDSHMGTLYQNQTLFEVLFRVAHDNNLLIRVSKEWFAAVPYLPSLISDKDVVVNGVISIDPSITPEGWSKYYADAIRHLQPGITEMIVHLAYDDEEMKGITFAHPNWGSEWRQRDFQYVISNDFRKLLRDNDIKLVTWREVTKSLLKP